RVLQVLEDDGGRGERPVAGEVHHPPAHEHALLVGPEGVPRLFLRLERARARDQERSDEEGGDPVGWTGLHVAPAGPSEPPGGHARGRRVPFPEHSGRARPAPWRDPPEPAGLRRVLPCSWLPTST